AHRGTTAEVATDEVRVDHRHEAGLVGLGERTHGKPAGDVDRRPQIVDSVEDPRHGRLVGEIAAGNEFHALVAAMGKALDLLLVRVGHMAAGAGREQRAHDGNPESAGPTGDDDVTIAIVHDCDLLMRWYEPPRMRSSRPSVTPKI